MQNGANLCPQTFAHLDCIDNMATVLITGGTGFIGQALTRELLAKGYEVIILTRKKNHQPSGGLSYAEWDIEKQFVDPSAIQKADYIVHLAGANVADGRWTESRKKEILESRTKTAGLLVKGLKEIPNKVRAVVSASGIGWYGEDPRVPNPTPFVETDKADPSFLGETCKLWEASIDPVKDLGKRLVTLRTGIVLGRGGGAYKEFEKPFYFGAATILGNGRQVLSWIHLNDIAGIYLYAIESENMEGVFNAVAPGPVSNKELMMTMKRIKGGLAIPVKVPEFALKIVLGEMSIEVLKSATVSSKKIEAQGYQFQFPTIEAAVRNLMQKS